MTPIWRGCWPCFEMRVPCCEGGRTLAETAALLVLAKKLSAVFHAGENP